MKIQKLTKIKTGIYSYNEKIGNYNKQIYSELDLVRFIDHM
jgi:hypothetical protein